MYIEIDPQGKPRPRVTKKGTYYPAKYKKYEDDLRKLYRGRLSEKVSLVFEIPMPRSWSKKKKESMNGKYHQSKPDIDNLIKAVLDALCYNDSYVAHVVATKYWNDKGGIWIKCF